MAVRKYIGARYVPNFRGEYDVTSIYDALDVVDNGAGTAYIARKTVPAGTPLTNNEFWFVYGASSGAILDLTNRMGVVEQKTQNLDNDGTMSATDIDYLNTNVEQQLKAVSGDARKIMIFTDSYGMSDNQGGFCSRLKSQVEGANSNYSIEFLANSGFGFVGNDGTFLSVLQNWAAGKTEEELKTYTDIFAIGGWNDYNKTASTIQSAIITFSQYVKTLVPNAKLSIGFVGFDTQSSINMTSAITAYKTGSRLSGSAYIANSEYVCRVVNWMADTRHPNATGYQNLADFLARYIFSGYSDVYYNAISPDIVYNSGITCTGSGFQKVENGQVQWYLTGGSFINSNNFSVQADAAHPIELGSIKGCLLGNPAKATGVMLSVVYTVPAGLVYGTAQLYINAGKLYLLPFFAQGLASSGATQVGRIYYADMCTTLNTLLQA